MDSDQAQLLAELKEHGVVSDDETPRWSDKEWAQFMQRHRLRQRRNLKERIVNEVIKSIPEAIEGIANVQVIHDGPQSAYIRVQPSPDGDITWGADQSVHCYSVKIAEMKRDPMAGHPVPYYW